MTSHRLQRRQRLDAILAESPSFLLSQEEDKETLLTGETPATQAKESPQHIATNTSMEK